MRKLFLICALFLTLSVCCGAPAYLLRLQGGRICYREMTEDRWTDTGKSALSVPGAEDRALLSRGLLLPGRAALTRALEDFCS